MDLLSTIPVGKVDRGYRLDIFKTEDADMGDFNEEVQGNFTEIPVVVTYDRKLDSEG